MAGVEGWGFLQRIRRLQLRALVARGLGHHAPQWVNHRRNTGIGIAQQPAIVFHSAHACLVQVLPRSASLAVPPVVRDVDEQFSAVFCELPDFVREDRLVTEKRANLRVTHFQWEPRFAAGEGPDLAGKPTGKAEYLLERHVPDRK